MKAKRITEPRRALVEEDIVDFLVARYTREPVTCRQIGRLLGISNTRVRQIEAKALEKLAKGLHVSEDGP